MIKNPIGFTVKFNRIHKKLSGRKLSKLVGIDHAVLIKIEDGSRATSPYEQRKIFKELGITFREDRTFVIEAKRSFDLLYHAIAFQDHDIDSKYEIFKKYCHENQEAEITLIYSLMEFIYRTTFKRYDEQYESYMNIISKYLSYLSKNYQSLFHDYVGVYYRDKAKYDNSLLQLTQAEDLVEDNLVYSMICYHRAATLALNNDLLTSMKEYEKSINLFTENLNFKRVIQSKMSEAAIYSKIGKINIALDMFAEIIDNAGKIKMNDIFVSSVYRNMAWCKMLQNNYDEVIFCANQSLAYTEFHNNAYFALVWSYMQKEDYELVRITIKKIDEHYNSLKNELLNGYIDVVNKIIEKAELVFIHAAYLQLIDKLEILKDYETLKFILFDAVSFFKKEKLESLNTVYYEIMFNIVKNTSNS